MTVFFTNILLMGLKVADVFSIANTSKNIFYSAYLKNRVQYNDVDPDKIQLADDSAVKIDINPDTAIADTKAIHDVLDTIIVNVSKEIEAMDIDGEPKVEELPDDSDDDTNFLVEKSSIDDNISAQPTDELVQSKDAFVAEDNVRLEYVYKQKSESATFQESHPYINSDESNTESAENNTETVQSNTETVQSNTESADNSV
jgi:hypothetical protein